MAMTTTQAVPERRPTLTLSNGSVVRVKPLLTRETIKLAKIVTNGSASFLPQVVQMASVLQDKEALNGMIIALAVTSIPEAEAETMEFLQAIVEPADLPEKDGTRGNDIERGAAIAELYSFLNNPPMDDTLDIIYTLLEAEKDNLQSLGKKIMQISRVLQTTPPAAKKAPAKRAAKKTTARTR